MINIFEEFFGLSALPDLVSFSPLVKDERRQEIKAELLGTSWWSSLGLTRATPAPIERQMGRFTEHPREAWAQFL